MDAKHAIMMAKATFNDLFIDEQIQNLGLEEVVFDQTTKTWHITLGFYRTLISNGPFGIEFPTDRILKVVSLSDVDGTPISVRNREQAQV